MNRAVFEGELACEVVVRLAFVGAICVVFVDDYEVDCAKLVDERV